MSDETQRDREITELKGSVKRIESALLGTPEKPESGALHMLTNLADDVYSPKEPSQSYERRIRTLEDSKKESEGAKSRSNAIWLVAAVFLGGGSEAFFAWLFTHIH